MYVREQPEAKAFVALTEVEINHASNPATETEPVHMESEAVPEQFRAREDEGAFGFEIALTGDEFVEEPGGSLELPATTHQQIDALFDEFAVVEAAGEREEGEEGADGNIELNMTKEELIAELDALFGAEGYMIIGGAEMADDA